MKMPHESSGHAARSGSAERTSSARSPRRWTFLSNHAHVLVCLQLDPQARIRDLAGRVGITERAVQSILADLQGEGLVERHKNGRRNSYVLHLHQPLRHPIEAHREVRELVEMVLHGHEGRAASPTPNRRPS